MLITFKSRAAGDVIMFGEVAGRMLSVMGKDAGETRGIITLEQLPAAIEKLRAAAAADKTQTNGNKDTDADDDAPRGMSAAVSFAQRAAPLIELMNFAQRDGEPVIWESGK